LNEVPIPVIIINDNDARIIINGYAIEWSKLSLDNLPQYSLIQSRMRELVLLKYIDAEFDAPLDFEMEYLWV
jgi:hypothetical protein